MPSPSTTEPASRRPCAFSSRAFSLTRSRRSSSPSPPPHRAPAPPTVRRSGAANPPAASRQYIRSAARHLCVSSRPTAPSLRGPPAAPHYPLRTGRCLPAPSLPLRINNGASSWRRRPHALLPAADTLRAPRTRERHARLWSQHRKHPRHPQRTPTSRRRVPAPSPAACTRSGFEVHAPSPSLARLHRGRRCSVSRRPSLAQRGRHGARVSCALT